MATLFADRKPRLAADTFARLLDEVGVPILLAGALVTMLATIAGLARPLV
jgi:hypothetical protein